MNAEILGLLRDAGIPWTPSWKDVIVLYNYAPIPVRRSRVGAEGWNRGFSLAVLAANGEPAYFCKFRPAGDAVLERETLIRTCLAGDRRGGLSVSPVKSVASARIAVQVSPFLRGPNYGTIAPGQSTVDFIDTLRTVLVGAGELARIALRDCPTMVRTSAATIHLATAAADSIANVTTLAALARAQSDALTAVVVDAGDVPSRPQHGDFWWQNLLMVDGHLWAIDFDSYGEVCVPLYDDLTLMVTTLGVRPGAPDDVLARLTASNDSARACRSLLAERARSEGLSISQLDGLFVYYLAHLASTVHRRGGTGFATPYVKAILHTAEQLETGKRGLLSSQ
jgi:hypothetical protein